MPVFVIPGNHDRRDNFRAALKHLPGVMADPHYVQYAVDDFPVRLIMLDTLVPGAGHGELRAEQLEFLDRTLAAAPDKPTIIGMHHPPFACGIANLDTINLRNTPEFTAIIARHRQVDRIICGHHHRAVVTRVAHAIASISPSVAHQVEMSMKSARRGRLRFRAARLSAAPLDGGRRHRLAHRLRRGLPGPLRIHQRSGVSRRGVSSHRLGVRGSSGPSCSPRPLREGAGEGRGGPGSSPCTHATPNARWPVNRGGFRFARG